MSLNPPIDSMGRQLNFQRLFPQGGTILLTEDFMVHEKDASVIILAWFSETVRKRPPKTWKLMLRPNVINWLGEKFQEDGR